MMMHVRKHASATLWISVVVAIAICTIISHPYACHGAQQDDLAREQMSALGNEFSDMVGQRRRLQQDQANCTEVFEDNLGVGVPSCTTTLVQLVLSGSNEASVCPPDCACSDLFAQLLGIALAQTNITTGAGQSYAFCGLTVTPGNGETVQPSPPPSPAGPINCSDYALTNQVGLNSCVQSLISQTVGGLADCPDLCNQFLAGAPGCRDDLALAGDEALLQACVGIGGSFSVCDIQFRGPSSDCLAANDSASPPPLPQNQESWPPPPPPGGDSSVSAAVIAAIAIGSIAGVAVIGIGSFFAFKKCSKRGEATPPPAAVVVSSATASQPPLLTIGPMASSHQQEVNMPGTHSTGAATIKSPFSAPSHHSLAPTLPEGSLELASSKGSLQTISPAGSDPILKWASQSLRTAPVRRSGPSGVPEHVQQLEFTWPNVQIIKSLGLGSFGKVYLAKLHHTPVALKVLVDAKAAAATSTGLDSDIGEVAMPSRDKLAEEVTFMAPLRHPNVVNLIGWCIDPPCVAMEYAARGSLYDVLQQGARDPAMAAELNWERRVRMAADAAAGMLHLHTRSPMIIHRDLKSPNLLVAADWTVKVADMGMSSIVNEATRNSLATAGGASNPRWLANEVLNGGRHTAASDVFSFGICLWELLVWRLPWEGINPFAIMRAVVQFERLAVPPLDKLPGFEGRELPVQALNSYIALMQRCWAADPARRPDFEVIAAELSNLE